MGHQLGGDSVGKFSIQTARDIDGGQLGEFEGVVVGQLDPFPVEVGALGICLRADGNILACGH